MAGITSKITFWVICFCYVSGLMTSLHIMPGVNTAPLVNSSEFAAVGQPGDNRPDPWIGPWQLIWNAAMAVVGSFWNIFYIFSTLTTWGFPPEIAVAAQGLLIVLYGYDMFALWKGYDII